MARKTASFKLNNEKKVIVLYDNVEQSTAEKNLVEYYLKNGYTPMFETKKKGKTVAEMRKDLESDKETLEKFNAAYNEKNGFHSACKIYTTWKKENKNK